MIRFAIVVLGSVVVAAACAASPSEPAVRSQADSHPVAPASAGGASAALPTSSPVDPPTPSAAPVPGGLEVGHIAEIVTTDLVVRSLPEISDASVIDPSRVPFGYLAYIVDGPVAADGYDWYQVAPFPPDLSDVVEEHPAFGWLAAAGKDAEPWIAPWDGGCPQPGWDGLMLSPRFVMLSCWGGVDLTLEGTLRSCDTSGPPNGEPAWLFAVPCRLAGPDYGELLAGGLALHFAPGLHAPSGDGAGVRVTGHLGDPAADTCTEEPLPGTEPTPPDLVRVRCRLNFVVTEITAPQG